MIATLCDELQKVVDGVVEQTESSDQIYKMSVGEFGR